MINCVSQVGRGPIVTEQLSINSSASWHFIDAGITGSEFTRLIVSLAVRQLIATDFRGVHHDAKKINDILALR